jgi:prolyl-tRNA synthetase
MQRALSVSRADNFPEWYQALVKEADLAENSPTRGCMIIKPWGFGLWEQIQAELDRRIKDAGHDNYYFPLLIPLSFFAAEAEHVDGFAKEMAVVTHHRLKMINGALKPDPDAELTEPLIIRPTSETIIGDAFSRWIKSYRDLPVLLNQWANVMRWEMRTRMFLRTAEFLWQEGHTAHVDAQDAMAHTMRMLEVYRSFAEDYLALPVIAGEKPANERFPGADNTFSIEAMMQDGKALQAGTSHYLGTHFSSAQNIRYQDNAGVMQLAHTTSWGVSTRMIGGVVMTHGDDDGLRTPPAIAPKQIVIVPMLRDKPEDADVLAYAQALKAELSSLSAFGQRVRAHVDVTQARSADKRWAWVRRGAPLILEIGGRDAAAGQITFMRRDQLRVGDKIQSHAMARGEFMAAAASLLEAIQTGLFEEAKARLHGNIRTDLQTFADVAAYFGAAGEEEAGPFKGWVRVGWAKPEGAALDAVDAQLKALKLTIRNAPLDQSQRASVCAFTGAPAVEDVLIARAY